MTSIAKSSFVLFVEGSFESQTFTYVTDCHNQKRVVIKPSPAYIAQSEFTTSLQALERSLPKNYKAIELFLFQSSVEESLREEWEKKLFQIVHMIRSSFVRAISFLPKNPSTVQVVYAEKYNERIGPTWQWLVEPYPEGKIGKCTSQTYENVCPLDRHKLSTVEGIESSIQTVPSEAQGDIQAILKEFVLDPQTEAVAITYQSPENDIPVTQLWSKIGKYLGR